MPVQLRRRLLPCSSTPYVQAEVEELLKISELPGSSTPAPPKSSNEESDLETNLRLALSLHSPCPSSSSSANTPAKDAPFRKIGAGACGAIFSQDGNDVIVKLAKDRTNPELWNDFCQHRKIARCFADLFSPSDPPINIPQPLGFVTVAATKTSFWAAESSAGLIKAAQDQHICAVPTNALIAERILPLPPRTRHLLIEKYCAPRGKQKALADPANSDCLVRVYLGSMTGKSGGMFFSLRNLKLHLNQLIELDLDIAALSRRMGIALAVMHWGARTDARDVEFVLGSSSRKKVPRNLKEEINDDKEEEEQEHDVAPATYHGLEDFYCRETEMWVLDFNQVRDITLDDAGVALAVEAVKLNDPYFPKPLKNSEAEKHAWKAFAVSYLENATTILQQARQNDKDSGVEILALPRKFILGITDLERERMSRREGGNA